MYHVIIPILNTYLGTVITYDQLIHFELKHPNVRLLKCALWFEVKMLYKVFQEKVMNVAQFLKECIKELDWNIDMGRRIGGHDEMSKLRGIIVVKVNLA